MIAGRKTRGKSMLVLHLNGSSDYAKGKNNFRQGGVPDGGDASKPIGMKLSVTLHSDEARRNSGVKRWKAP